MTFIAFYRNTRPLKFKSQRAIFITFLLPSVLNIVVALTIVAVIVKTLTSEPIPRHTKIPGGVLDISLGREVRHGPSHPDLTCDHTLPPLYSKKKKTSDRRLTLTLFKTNITDFPILFKTEFRFFNTLFKTFNTNINRPLSIY